MLRPGLRTVADVTSTRVRPARALRRAEYDLRVRTIAYFGPPGTFTEEALLTQDDLAACVRTAQRSVPDVINTVERGEFDAGLVPSENMMEGGV